jgi:ubiquinone/menaquinone biosynthesis C-methylase UbiE
MRAATLCLLSLGWIASLATGCRGTNAPRDGLDTRTRISVATDAPAAPATSQPVREAAAPIEARASQTAPNRDTHGEGDVPRYIQSLEAPKRVAELQVDVVLQKLELPSDAEIGDLGCGPGIFALAFARAATEGVVYASDIEPRQLDEVRAKIRASGLDNIVPVLASSDSPHFPPARLDMVFVADTYHHLENRVEYMRRLQRTLKPGGRLVLLEYKPGELPVGPAADHKLGAGQLERELTEAGFKRVARFDTHPYHDFEVWRVLQPWER